MPRRLRKWGVVACAAVLMAATAHAAAAIDFSTGAGDDVYSNFVTVTDYVRAMPDMVIGLDMFKAVTEPATMMVLGMGLLTAFRARRRGPA
jgi:hypothetical protein